MGRIEKQKRELIEESNKRMLGEQIRTPVRDTNLNSGESTDVGKKEEPINQKDEQGNKMGLWKSDEGGKTIESYYKDGKLSMEGESKNDKRIGIWKSYYDNGELKSETTYGDHSDWTWTESSRCWNENGLEIVCCSVRYKNTEILKKPYTFTDGKGKTYQGVVDCITDDYTLEVAIDVIETVCGGGVLELYIDKNQKKWVISTEACGEKTRKEFLKFTNGGLIQDELLALAPWK